MEQRSKYKVPFKTPLDYWVEALDRDPANINRFHQIQMEKPEWAFFDRDLHVYPYIKALPTMLSMGCQNTCYFCPTAKEFRGKVHRGDPEVILPHYAGRVVHFMDENFFENDLETVLPLLQKYQIHWLGMSTAKSLAIALEWFGEDALYAAGCRVVEVGLENIVLMDKVSPYPSIFKMKKIVLYLLNMTFLPGETKATIFSNSRFMQAHSVGHPIHFNNGLWYAPGQFFFPYEAPSQPGQWLEGKYARTRPTWVPDTFLSQDYTILNLEKVNWYSQMVYDFKILPNVVSGLIRDFVKGQEALARWMTVGLRVGGII